MSESVNFHSLLTQLQTRYPTSSLISELVQVHGDRFVVRALVQLGGVALVTSMAAAATIEQAEDQAKLRVLAMLGIGVGDHSPLLPFSPPSPASDADFSSNLPKHQEFPPTTSVPTSFEEAAADVAFRSAPIPPLPLESRPVSKPIIQSRSHSSHRSRVKSPPGLEELPQLNGATASEPIHEGGLELVEEPFTNQNFQNTDTDFTPEPADETSSEPVDLSELIALTDVEMERIGWSKKRGQSHLKRTYGKQTRAELNEDQLMEFLHYLRALPSGSSS
ncbi:hypothetical protein [Leptothermofonsia sp. ETS-13]|uniref:hypothetical protein n=1 Tax=Leptothermofonsia sp. ETS-13 TaxID=3035696 RepID=UPI003BA36F4F